MTNSTRQRTGALADRGRDTYTGAIQWEIFSEEGRPLLWSHFVSTGLGLTFLMLVIFGPQPITGTVFQDEPRVRVDLNGWRESRLIPANRSEIGGQTSRGAGDGGQRAPARSGLQGAIAAAFRSGGFEPGGMVGVASGALRGVQTNSGTGYAGLASTGGAGQAGKAVLSYGGSGNGSTGLGRAGISDGSGGGRIGGVGGGGSVTRSSVSVSAPSVIAQELAGPGRDVGQLGAVVRNRQAVLQSCYTQQGLAVNSKLAGTIDVAITLGGAGGVTRVDARPRSMSGPGTSQVLSCIEGQILRWRFPASEAGSGTYSFPFSFTS